tara:strand:+ start:364 stop:3066 length:2703 start_codon:yes stop_codon:yes gene_type:complete
MSLPNQGHIKYQSIKTTKKKHKQKGGLKIRPDGVFDPDGKYRNPYTGRPYSDNYTKFSKSWRELKTYKEKATIMHKIDKFQIILVIAGTGVGKTVIIPKLLAHYFDYKTPIIVTTPRQKTTDSAVEWASRCLNVPLYYSKGGVFIKNKPSGLRHVGVKHGGITTQMDNETTNILYATDGTIQQLIIQNDPLLEKYGGIIIDEAHERSVSIDILITLVTRIAKARPDFKVIIMSATVNEQVFIDYYKRMNMEDVFTIYNAPGKKTIHDVKEIYLKKKIKAQDYIKELYKIVFEILTNPDKIEKDILVFVTSDSKAKELVKLVQKDINKIPSYSKPYSIVYTRNTEGLDANIATKKNGLSLIPYKHDFTRKLIVSTNVAESSVTFEDPLGFVIESGLEFSNIYDAELYSNVSDTLYVAKANITQRCGRTGRTCAGECHKLYTEKQYKNFPDYPKPKIMKEDFTSQYLGIINLEGVGTVEKVNDFLNEMIEPLENYQIFVNRAEENLKASAMINSKNKLTYLGYICNKFGKYDYKIGKLIIVGYYFGILGECIALGAIMHNVRGIEDFFYKPQNMDPNQQKEYWENILKYRHDSGDHLTLLRIFLQWMNSYDKSIFCDNMGLSDRVLDNILDSYEELKDTVTKIYPDLLQLKLFESNANIQSGGKNIKNNIKKYKYNKYYKKKNGSQTIITGNVHNVNRIFKHNGGIIHENESYGRKSKKYDVKTWKRKIQFNKYRKYKSRKFRKSKERSHRGGKFAKREQKGELGSFTPFKKKKGDIKRQFDMKKRENKPKLQPNRKEKEFIDNYNLNKNFKKRINANQKLSDSILCCLLFSYTTQIGISIKSTNKYYIKYSPLTPGINKSIFSKLNRNPRFILYNKCDIMNDKENLSIISELPQHILTYFL